MRTTNPRRLFRYLKNALEEMGYFVVHDSVNIQKDDIGDAGYVDSKISAHKRVQKMTGGWRKEKTGLIVMAAGVILAGVGFWYSTLTLMGIGMIPLLIGSFAVVTAGPTPIAGTRRIWISADGEVYRGQVSRSSEENSIHRDQIISELTISIAGESLIDLQGLKTEIDQITEKIEALRD